MGSVHMAREGEMKVVTARRFHRCGRCGKGIEPKEKYTRRTALLVGRTRISEAFCQECKPIE